MKTSKTLQYLPVEAAKSQNSPQSALNRETTDLKVTVFYDKGGVNYFNGDNSRRGYYLSVRPVTVTKFEASPTCPGYTSEVFALFSGLKRFLVEAKVFSQKKFNDLQPDPATVNELVQAVLVQSDLKLKEEANVPA